MKLTRRWSWLPLCLCLLTCLETSAVRAQDSPPKGEVLKRSFSNSQIFPGTYRDYWIYVPRQYDPAKPACVYVNQDGIQYNAPQVFDQLIASGEMPVLLTPANLRPYIRSLIERFRPATPVLSQNEIHPRAKIKTVGSI